MHLLSIPIYCALYISNAFRARGKFTEKSEEQKGRNNGEGVEKCRLLMTLNATLAPNVNTSAPHITYLLHHSCLLRAPTSVGPVLPLYLMRVLYNYQNIIFVRSNHNFMLLRSNAQECQLVTII